MKARFAHALAGGLMGFGQGKLQQIEKEEAELKSQRALQAQMAMQERVAQIRAEYAGKKDERDHEQARELKGMEVEAADKRAAATIAAADKRSQESNASRERAATTRANRPSGSGTPPKASLFYNEDTGEQRWVTPGEDIPPGFFRAPASGKPKPSQKPRETAPAAQPGSSQSNPLDATTTSTRPPSGTWVKLPSGAVVQVP